MGMGNTYKIRIAIAVSLLSIVCASRVRQQAVEVRGKLMCGDIAAHGVRVKLWDEDGGPDPDDQLDQGYTDIDGYFFLKGDTSEITNIDPVLKIYHDCDDGIKPGSRKIKFKIPKSYTSAGQTAEKTFDIGKINLEIEFAGEERELLTSRRRRVAHNSKNKPKGKGKGM